MIRKLGRVALPLLLLDCFVAGWLSVSFARRDGDTQVLEEVKGIAQSNNQFAFDLYAQLRTSESGNLFFSPTSISTALAMTYAGAEGDTEKEMANVLRFNLPEEQVHAAHGSLLATLNASSCWAFCLPALVASIFFARSFERKKSASNNILA